MILSACETGADPPRGYFVRENGAYVQNRSAETSERIYLKCRPQYQLVGGTASVICQASGLFLPDLAQLGQCRSLRTEFSFTTATRKPQTTTTVDIRNRFPKGFCKLPVRENGFFRSPNPNFNTIINGTWVIPSRRAQLICSDGSTVVNGVDTAICRRANLQWSFEFGYCTRPSGCDWNNFRVENAQLIGLGSQRSIQCDPGFLLQGDTTVYCRDGRLSLPGFCVRVSEVRKTCDFLPNLLNAKLETQTQSPFIGEWVNVQCDRGYHLDTPRERSDQSLRCNPDGRWTDWTGRCVDDAVSQNCGPLPEVPDATFQDGTNEVGAIRSLKCNERNTEVVGPTIVTCCWNGQWTEPGACYSKGKVSHEAKLIMNNRITTCPSQPGDLKCTSCLFIYFSSYLTILYNLYRLCWF